VKRIDHVAAVASDEIALLTEMREPVWPLLGWVCNWPGARLCSAVVSAAHCCLAGIHGRVFSSVMERPWTLAMGDIATNIDALAAEEDPPDEPVSSKI